jgi:ankyrin repeat protein/F0F1-type ATP synthase delta subunit
LLNKLSQSVNGVCNTLLYRLYSHATADSDNLRLLEACNSVFANPKTKKMGNTLSKSSKEDSLPEFAEAFSRLAALLKKNVVVVLDAVDNLPPKDQEELSTKLEGLLNTTHLTSEVGVQIRVLVGCRSSTKFFHEVAAAESPVMTIDISPYNRMDVDIRLTAALTAVPGLTEAEQEEAKEAILEKAGPKFSYVADIAIPFIREPFQRPLSNRLKALPEGMNDAYNEALRKMAPNYIDLLRSAVTWTLLAPVPPKVEEVMEDFYGLYDNADATLVDGVEPVFPPPSQLEVEQLQDASGPFLQLIEDSEHHYVYLQDPPQIENFCLNVSKATNGIPHEASEEVCCSRCQSEISQAKNLSVVPKQAHLEIAIKLLRHLNNPLFQQRAGFISPESKEDTTKTEKEAQPEDKAEAEEQTQTTDDTTKAEAVLENGPVEEDKEAAKDNEEEKAPEEPNDSGYETDVSMDGEDYGLVDLTRLGRIEKTTEEEEEYTGESYGQLVLKTLRYEVQYWPHHLREAEDLWTPEERANEPLWKAVMAELDKFVNGKREVFEAWQMRFYNDSTDFTMSEPHSPLHVAAFLGITSWAAHLINTGADPNELSINWSPLQAAAVKGERYSMLKLLLERGADINKGEDEGWTPFYAWMMQDCSIESITLMLEHGARRVVQGDPKYWSPLHCFASQGEDPEVLKLLLTYGPPESRPDINWKNEIGATPLHLILYRREVPKPLLKSFLEHGADVNSEQISSSRPLQLASLWGDLESVKIIRPDVSDVDDPDQDGDTALHQAALYGHTECVKFLAENGAGVDFPNLKGRTSLMDAAAAGYKNTVQCLLEHGADPTLVDKHSRTPLFMACLSDSRESVQLLFDALVTRKVPLSGINKTTKSGRTVLRQAAAMGHDILVEGFIKLATAENDPASLLIDAKDSKKGMTALHRAAWHGHVSSVRLLLGAKPDIAIKDAKGKTAIVLAYEQWTLAGDQSAFEEIISLLIEEDPAAASQDAELAAICATNGSTKLLQQLHHLGADLNRQDKYGWTPLELAKKFQKQEAEEFLKQQAAWAGMLPSIWAPFSDKVNISEDGLHITHTSGDRICVSTDKPLPAGLETFYFEIMSVAMKDTEQYLHPEMGIGFCTLGGEAIQFPGWPARADAPSAKSWGYHGDDGGMYNTSGEDDSSDIARSYKPGDTVGCGVDLATRTIWFTKNGTKLDQTFTNVQGRLFPLVGLSDVVQLQTNFTGPFMWKNGSETQETESEPAKTEELAEETTVREGNDSFASKLKLPTGTELIVEGIKTIQLG